MRVHHGVDRAILEAPWRGDAQAGGAVLEAPVRKYRRPETSVPESPIGVHRRAADGGERAKMLDDAANCLQADLARKLDVVRVGHEGVLAASRIHEVLLRTGEFLGVVAERLHLVLATAP